MAGAPSARGRAQTVTSSRDGDNPQPDFGLMTQLIDVRERHVTAFQKTTNLDLRVLEEEKQLLGSRSPSGERRAGCCFFCPLVGVLGAGSVSTLPFFGAVTDTQVDFLKNCWPLIGPPVRRGRWKCASAHGSMISCQRGTRWPTSGTTRRSVNVEALCPRSNSRTLPRRAN